MEYRRLGASDLVVPEISLGTWLTFGTHVERERAAACIDRAFDLGINFFDTANVYGRGRAESFLGEVLAGRPRDSYLLATKAFFPMTETDKGLSAVQIRKQSEGSLRRLRTDHVDLYQCHRYDPDTPLEETMQALTDLVESGKARYLGFSEWPVEHVRRALDLADVARFVASQPLYSMLWRKPEEELIPLCRDEGISQIVFSPLAQGVLTGKYRPGQPPPEGTRAATEGANQFIGRWHTDEVLEGVERLRPVADAAGLTLAQLALAWILREPNVAACLVGASRPAHLDDNAGASGIRLDADTLAAIDEALEPVAAR